MDKVNIVIAENPDGTKRRIILNEDILLVNRLDSLSFPIKDNFSPLGFTINISFSDEGEQFTTTGDVVDDGKTWNINLHKWDGPDEIELTNPIEGTNSSGKKIWLKFKTKSNREKGYRSFHITLWIEEQ